MTQRNKINVTVHILRGGHLILYWAWIAWGFPFTFVHCVYFSEKSKPSMLTDLIGWNESVSAESIPVIIHWFMNLNLLLLYFPPNGYFQFEIIINVLVSSFCFTWISIVWVREGHGAMVRAWRSADVAACRAVSNPAWCRIFREIMFLPSQSWDIVKMLCPWARHFTLKCFTWLS